MNLASPTSTAVSAQSLLNPYVPPAGAYDEMVAPDHRIRGHWRQLSDLLDALGPQELSRRWEQAQRLLREDGVTYNVHGGHGRDRRWELDPLPLLVEPLEWERLSVGLVQRARLLNALLADIYGPQVLLREGILPPEIVLGHPNFLRPCHGWSVPNNRYLHLYASHMVRSPDGAWWAVADRTQMPVGPGYAVENRIVVSRMLPHVFHHCRVQRLAGFFIALRETLTDLAVRNRDNPHTVLLSTGPTSPTYFEDAYLARYLGYTLVEGEDLTVRDNRVFLKTLGGLINVDVILRRVRDRDCDPLQLNGQSRWGVAGLTHAARRGNVLIANALGSGLLESPALMAYLPAVARRLLDEELRIPSVPTWWCGDPRSLQTVLDRLEHLVIRPVFPDPMVKPLHGASLSKSERNDLAARIRDRPSRFVGQELIARSTAPVWVQGKPEPGHIALRTFAVASGDSYQVMPGALAHVGGSIQALGDSMFIGQGSKDVWVPSEGPVAAVTLLQPPGTPVLPRRSGKGLPSRVADNLFWLGRHVERAECAARLLRSILTRLISESAPGSVSELPMLLRALNYAGPGGEEETKDLTIDSQVMAILYDDTQPGSLHAMLSALRRVASIVRDRISLDSWRILNRIDDDFHSGYPLGVVSLSDLLTMLNQMIFDFSAFSGVAMENMTRGPGWQFLDMGRRIERALAMMALLRSALHEPSPDEHAVLDALLEIADSAMTYRSRYATNIQVAPVLDLLLTDETNPRSIRFQLVALSAHVERLPRQQSDMPLTAEQRAVMAVLSMICLSDVQALSEVNESGAREELDRLLSVAANELHSLANEISHKYLVHAGPSYQMADISLRMHS